MSLSSQKYSYECKSDALSVFNKHVFHKKKFNIFILTMEIVKKRKKTRKTFSYVICVEVCYV